MTWYSVAVRATAHVFASDPADALRSVDRGMWDELIVEETLYVVDSDTGEEVHE